MTRWEKEGRLGMRAPARVGILIPGFNNEAFLNPRVNGYFEMHAGTSGITFLQNIVDGSQPIAIFNSLDKSVEFLGDLDIPNFYKKTEVDNLITKLQTGDGAPQNQVFIILYSSIM